MHVRFSRHMQLRAGKDGKERKHYPFSNQYFENYIKRLNSKNITFQQDAILNHEKNVMIEQKTSTDEYTVDDVSRFYRKQYLNQTGDERFKSFDEYKSELEEKYPELFNHTFHSQPLVISKEVEQELDAQIYEIERIRKAEEKDAIDVEHSMHMQEDDDEDVSIPEAFYQKKKTLNQNQNMNHKRNFEDIWKDQKRPSKEGNFERFHKPLQSQRKQMQHNDGADSRTDTFELVKHIKTRFADIGGYDSVKHELRQCVDILSNYHIYSQYNVRIPKGLILEGPPGNGKTLLAKGFAGESNCSFITVAGSEFQEKYVGVGSARIKELFKLAQDNSPCIIFIDEIDAVGRKRSSDADAAASERDNTLNQLLVAMDGFEASEGVFIIGASNRADLLDPALVRPGRIDKRIYISVPDAKTREAILQIHIQGKPHEKNIHIMDLVDLTNGMSAAQIENVLNEAMLHAIRHNRTEFSLEDIDVVMNRILAGWQPTEHQFSHEMIEQIVVHEMGHAMVGFLARQHAKLTKIVINLSSPNSPGYTVFEGTTSALYTRESLFEHLMILLAGRVAEEVFYNVSVTTGAINDFEEALKLAEKMVVYYGMGSSLIYPSNSEKYKERIDNEVVQLIQDAYHLSRFIVSNCKDVITYCTKILKSERIIRREELVRIIEEKYPDILDLYVGTSATLYD